MYFYLYPMAQWLGSSCVGIVPQKMLCISHIEASRLLLPDNAAVALRHLNPRSTKKAPDPVYHDLISAHSSPSFLVLLYFRD